MSAQSQLLFFALREDLVALLREVEGGPRLQYVEMGQHPSVEVRRLSSGLEIPRLGQATADSAVASAAFLMAGGDAAIQARPLKQGFAIDQLANEDTVVFWPGGQTDDGVILHGRVASASDTAVSRSLLKAFTVAARRAKFKKVKSYWVGPHALTALRSGARLTISKSAAKEYDLIP